jgi:hypothetical protein
MNSSCVIFSAASSISFPKLSSSSSSADFFWRVDTVAIFGPFLGGTLPLAIQSTLIANRHYIILLQ